MKGRELADRIGRLIYDKKGREVVILDVRDLTSIADYFVIGSADSDPQVKAITEHIRERLTPVKPWHIEGLTSLNWVLLDFIDVVVHIFQPETREFYGLERLWGDAPKIEVEDEDETSGDH